MKSQAAQTLPKTGQACIHNRTARAWRFALIRAIKPLFTAIVRAADR
ncbi:MAG: hypothetical protein QHC67_12990 [Sphingobium sp.]|nr:hypothetical protein [Sphingobium sp.]MDX3910715.1 hypothetical protein [Sphingobium sp.]